jgi:hypothetical protein
MSRTSDDLDSMMFEGRVYLVINRINAKRYVGQTIVPLHTRWMKHLSDARTGRGNLLQNAMREVAREYGFARIEEFFELVELSSARSNQADLNALEKHWIAKLQTLAHEGWGYNLTDGGDSGAIVGPETRAKMSLAGFSRAPDSLEARLSKSQGQSRRWSSMDARKRHSQIQAVSQARPEVRAKRSVKQKERYADPAERAKQSFRMKLQYADPVERARLLEMSILRWKDPESRARESARMRARYASQEERDKQSVRQVLRFADPIKRAEHGVAIRKALKAKKALEHLVEDEPGLAETT